VLLVDDDRNNPDVQGPYTKALANNNIPYDYWDTSAFGSPSPTDLNAHQTVIWFTGSPTYDTLCPRDEIALADYLDQGGQLFLCSREYLKDVGRSSFNREYLHVGTYQEAILTTSIMGVPGNPVGNRLGTHPLSPHASFADLIHPYAPASGATTDAGGIFNGLTVDSSTWQVLFLAWPFENLAQPDADVVMLAAMSWFSWFNTQPEVSLPLVVKNY